MDVTGISVGGGEVLGAQADYPNAQAVAIGSSPTATTAFASATVVSLKANVACWYRIGGTAAAHVAGSDFLPANTIWMLKMAPGAIISFIQDSTAGWVSVMPMAGTASLPGPTPGPGTGPPPPLDAVTGVTCAVSFRLMRSGYGGKCMKVQRSSDSTFQDIGFDASGNFDVAGFNAFVGVGSGACDTWYDQSGNGYNLAYYTAGPRVPINLTGLNGKPTLAFAANFMSMQHVTTPSYAQPFSYNVVGYRTSGTATQGILGDNTNGTGILAYTPGNVTIYAGSVPIVACPDFVMHCLTGTFNGASSTLTIDGATISGLNVGGNGNTGLQIGFVLSDNLNGNVSEGTWWQRVLSAPDIASLGSNQKAYWGTP